MSKGKRFTENFKLEEVTRIVAQGFGVANL